MSIGTERQGLTEVTDRIVNWGDAQAVKVGLLIIFCHHTSASLLIQEYAAAAVRRRALDWDACLANPRSFMVSSKHI